MQFSIKQLVGLTKYAWIHTQKRTFIIFVIIFCVKFECFRTFILLGIGGKNSVQTHLYNEFILKLAQNCVYYIKKCTIKNFSDCILKKKRKTNTVYAALTEWFCSIVVKAEQVSLAFLNHFYSNWHIYLKKKRN